MRTLPLLRYPACNLLDRVPGNAPHRSRRAWAAPLIPPTVQPLGANADKRCKACGFDFELPGDDIALRLELLREPLDLSVQLVVGHGACSEQCGCDRAPGGEPDEPK